MKRFIVIVLDGVGVGELPDAKDFGDSGAYTFLHVLENNPSIKLPNLQKAGIGNLVKSNIIPRTNTPSFAIGKLAEKAKGKDSTTGHWEISGLDVKTQFPTYPNGFPKDIINKFVKLTDIPGILVNSTYSGTEVLKDFGTEHLKTKKPIIYTSADSVFQIACHEDIYPIEELYKMCEIARFEVFNNKQNVGRVIARPFLGKSANDFYRTNHRKDFSVSPPHGTIMDILTKNNITVAGVGKIEDLFAHRGLTISNHTPTNVEGIEQTVNFLKEIDNGFIFTNLVDFDSTWGHRRNHKGFAKGLEYFDKNLPKILSNMKENDILILTADHGCDPTFTGTDHTREYIPLMVYGQNVNPVNLGIRETFADIAATIAEFFDVEKPKIGTSFYNKIIK
jgi:phosphopentomutase